MHRAERLLEGAHALLARSAARHEQLCLALRDEQVAPKLRAAKEQLSTSVDEPLLCAMDAGLNASCQAVAQDLAEMVASCEDGLARAACGAAEDAHEALDEAVSTARRCSAASRSPRARRRQKRRHRLPHPVL